MHTSLDWKKFLEAQAQLENNNIGPDDRLPEKSLALAVELNEFANATKVFKYWSVQGPDRDHVLDEFADVFGFILTNLLIREIVPSQITYPTPTGTLDNRTLTLGFLGLMTTFRFPMSDEDFLKWISDFFKLGSDFGFTFENLESSYWRKWNVNLKRQNTGY